MTFEIYILQGFGEIKFGMNLDEISKILGQASVSENIDNGFGDPISVLHYDNDGVTLFFDGQTKKLNCVETSNENTKLFGEKIFDKTEQQIVKLMVDNKFYEQDIESEVWGERRVSFGDGNIDFFFADGKLLSVAFGE